MFVLAMGRGDVGSLNESCRGVDTHQGKDEYLMLRSSPCCPPFPLRRT